MRLTSRRKKLLTIYGSLGLVVIGGALTTSNLWSAIPLAWCGISLLVTAMAYAGLGSAVFGKKSDGKHSVFHWLLMMPTRTAMGIGQFFQIKRNPLCSGLIGQDLYVRALPSSFNEASLDMCAEFTRPVNSPFYRAHPVLDLVALSVDDIEAGVQAVQALKKDNSHVYINCALGKGRSVAIAIAWLVRSGQAPDILEAYALIKKARPCAVLPLETAHYLTIWHNSHKAH